MTPEKMIHMANQIATFMATQTGDGPISGAGGVAAHLKSYWEPRMKNQLYAHVDQGSAGLHPLVVQAVARLREPA